MAEDPKVDPPKDDPKNPDPKDDPEGLGEAGKKALEKERRARREAEKGKKALEDRLKALEDKDKSDSEKLIDAKSKAEKRAEEAETRVLRLEVAHEKGLTPAQAKRITGTTKEELEADADDFLESIKSDGKGTPPGGKPKEDLKGGGDPTADPEEMDPKRLADMVPRY